MSKGVQGVSNTFRRTWDRAEFEDKAKERDDQVRRAAKLQPALVGRPSESPPSPPLLHCCLTGCC